MVSAWQVGWMLASPRGGNQPHSQLDNDRDAVDRKDAQAQADRYAGQRKKKMKIESFATLQRASDTAASQHTHTLIFLSRKGSLT